MKKVTASIVFLLALFIFTSSTFASDSPSKNKNLNYEKVESNLLEGLKSDNFGLKVSSAYMLGEIKSEKAVRPLTIILRNDEDERARLVAALSLLKIGTDRSIFVVQQGKRFNESKEVRELCEHLYNTHLFNTFKGKEPDQKTLFAYLLSE